MVESDAGGEQPDPVGRLALVTGVSREQGIGRAVADRLVADGFTVLTAGWSPYDRRMPWGADASGRPPRRGAPDGEIRSYQVDFEDTEATRSLVRSINAEFGALAVLVLCHCESIDGDIATTTVEGFDRHMAVNARSTWQLIKGFAEQFPARTDADAEPGRIVAITSDHTAGNLPYGASKGAMDRIVLAAAIELADLGVTANLINPGATDTGWMTPDIEDAVRRNNLQPRLGRPSDTANLVGFLCSPQGRWINGQLLYSDGGRRP